MKIEGSKKSAIRESLEELVERLAQELSLSHETVANEAFYFLQRHSRWGRNATGAQKRASFQHWKEQCFVCNQSLEFSEAVFHHLKRGIADQHAPANLVPSHSKCHDRIHGVTQGSLFKGAPIGHRDGIARLRRGDRR